MADGCSKCKSSRLCVADGKTSDMFSAQIGEREHVGYVPRDLGIGGEDYVGFTYCLDCGQMQGTWPLPPTKLEES